jgi:heat shock protein HslJ
MPTNVAAVRLVAGLSILVIVAACDPTGSGQNTTPEPTTAVDLAGTSWTMVSVGGTPVVEGSGAAMTFDASGTVSGSTGCNSVNGSYSVDGAALTFGPLATTRMACEAGLMAQEAAVLEALAGVSGWEIDADGQLHLIGATELVLDPTEA